MMVELMKEYNHTIEKNKLKYYFNPNSEKSVDIIVNEIIKND
jgi:hypothetical protein